MDCILDQEWCYHLLPCAMQERGFCFYTTFDLTEVKVNVLSVCDVTRLFSAFIVKPILVHKLSLHYSKF